MRFLDITIFQTTSYLSLKPYALDFIRQLSLLISKPLKSLSEGEYFRATVSVLSFSAFVLTHIKHIKAPEYRQFGFLIDCYKSLSPVHWFQFAGNAAVISGQENANQHLFNRFTIWCKWAQMMIRVDKCITFGIKKFTTKPAQYKPKLLINTELVPCVEIGDSFRYVGRYFDFGTSNAVHKPELFQTVTDIMSKTDLVLLQPRFKLQLCDRYLLPKILWYLTVADPTKIWVSENFANLVANYFFRSWLDLPISGTLSNLSSLQEARMNSHPPSVKYAQCQTILRNLL